jgi:hypothetical protein
MIALVFIVIAMLTVPSISALAASKDWRSTGYNGTVIDQSTCNAAWAAAAVTVYQFEYLFSTSSAVQQDLSTSYIVDCSGCGGCHGGLLSNAIDFLIANGSYNLATYSNNNLYSGISNSSACYNTTGTIYKSSRTVYNNKHYKISNHKLKQLLQTAPTANEIRIDNTFFSYTGSSTFKCGYYVYNDGDLNSAVVVVGYTNSNQWIIRFFHGTSWGSGGYMPMHIGRDCGIRRKVYQISTTKYSSTALFVTILVFVTAVLLA